MQKQRLLVFTVALSVFGTLLLASTRAAGPAYGISTFTSWSWPQKAGGYNSLEYVIRPEIVPSTVPMFWAHQFAHVDGDGGFFGLQNSAGTPAGKIMLFSIFGGIDATGPEYVADFGSGYTARISYNWQQGVNYTFRLTFDHTDATGDWWRGEFVDSATGATHHVGTIKVPLSWQKLNGWGVGFIDSYSSVPTCAQQQHAGSVFFRPTLDGVQASSHSNSLGSTSDPNKTYCPNSYTIDLSGGSAVRHWLNAASAPPNEAPNANAGADQALTDNDGNGSETVTLNGASSADPDGVITTYTWSHDGQVIVSGGVANPVVTLPAGFTYVLQLQVSDDRGGTSTDTVQVVVNNASSSGGGSAPPPPPPSSGGGPGIIVSPSSGGSGGGSGGAGVPALPTTPDEEESTTEPGITEDPFGQIIYTIDEEGNEAISETGVADQAGGSSGGSSVAGIVISLFVVAIIGAAGFFALRNNRSQLQSATIALKPPRAPKQKKTKKTKHAQPAPSVVQPSAPVVQPTPSTQVPQKQSKGSNSYPWLPEDDPERTKYFPHK